MNRLRQIAFFIHASNSGIAIAGATLTYGICHHYNLEHALLYAAINLCLIFSVYTLQRFVDHEGFSELERNVWGSYSQFSIVLSGILILIALSLGWYVLQFKIVQLLLIAFFSLICLWYTSPLFGFKLRTIPGLKIVLIAFTWVYACVLFPLLNSQPFLTVEMVLFALNLLLYIAAVVLPFDIRDQKIDDVHQQTLPQIIGVRATKMTGTILLIVFIGLNYKWNCIAATNYFFAGCVVLQIVLLQFTSEKRSFFYFLLIDLGIGLLGLSYLF